MLFINTSLISLVLAFNSVNDCITLTYKDTSGKAITVHVVQGRQGSIAIRMGTKRLTINLREGEYPLDTTIYKPKPRSIVTKQFSYYSLVAIPCNVESGVYGYVGVYLFKIADNRLSTISTPTDFCFSDCGGFRILGKKILRWDMLYVPEMEDHRGEHRYVLEQYLVQKNNLKKVKMSKTSRKYQPFKSGLYLPLASRDDPLREFGLSWNHWW